MRYKFCAPLLFLMLASLACGGGQTDEPGPIADTVPIAPECEDVDTRGTPTGMRSLIPDPGTSRGPRCYGIPAGTEITFTWAEVPPGYDTVQIFRVNEAGDEELGIDDDLADGVAIRVTFEADMPTTMLYALASDIDGNSQPLMSDLIAVFIEE